MNAERESLDLTNAVDYHYGAFPPSNLDYSRLVRWVSAASAALARYDGMLRSLHNSEVLLAPLRRKEAVISSRIEGTVTTLDEVLKLEAEDGDEAIDKNYRLEVVEVFSYARALNHAQHLMSDGLPICGRLIKSAHSKLLLFGRGSDKQPRVFKRDQDYVVNAGRKEILFVPISPAHLDDGIQRLENFVNDEDVEPLMKTALSHLEFEALHPFKDDNGRVGRMLITLMLWNSGILSQPHFYISGCLEKRKDEYIERMRAVSHRGEWTEWCEFFLQVVIEQAEENLRTAEQIRSLYENMKVVFGEVLNSRHAITTLDYMMAKPVFRNSHFTASAGIPPQTAGRFSRLLLERSLLVPIEEASGRRSAVYAFEPLLKVVRA